MNRMNFQDCTVLITGASAGIGREFARQLAGRAGEIVLVARRADRLEELRDELRRSQPDLRVQVRATDLSDPAAIEGLCEGLEREKVSIDLLINNAGLGDTGPFSMSQPARVKEMMQVNIVALTSLTQRLLPAMIARQRGAILNVSSSASFLPLPNFAVYAATKAYVTSFSEALRAELRGTGVSVTALCPGPVHTEFRQVARRNADAPENIAPEFSHVSVEVVVRAGLSAVERDRPLVIPGIVMKVGMLLVRLTPMPLLRLASGLSAKRF